MNKKEKLALFLGMLSGDGCLSISHNGEGYRDYPIYFCNTDKKVVLMFQRLFLKLFNIEGNIYSEHKPNRQKLWYFLRYSVFVYGELINLGFPEGVKKDKLRVLPLIKRGSKKEKLAFIQGVIITDGSVKPRRGVMFHLGSRLFLEDLSRLISEFIGLRKPVKQYTQRKIHKSYQLYLNKEEREIILSGCPRGTMVLRRS